MDNLQTLTDAVKTAAVEQTTLRIVGGSSKNFLGNWQRTDSDLDVCRHSGIISYTPGELVIRVRCGTHLTEVESVLAENDQMLAFDPPHFGGQPTMGGVVASGIAGSRRPYAGAVKDYVLGVGLINGEGNYTEFGGQVMKNVAGYDVSRLVTGAFGTLGVIADVSLKVLPKPRTENSLVVEVELAEAMAVMHEGIRKPSSMSAACFMGGALYLRFSGDPGVVEQESRGLSGQRISNDFWRGLDDQSCAPFTGVKGVWRLSTVPNERVAVEEYDVMDWGGAQRWLLDPDCNPRESYWGAGHWTQYRKNQLSDWGGDAVMESAEEIDGAFQPLQPKARDLHHRLKNVFDPAGIFNPDRLYRDL